MLMDVTPGSAYGYSWEVRLQQKRLEPFTDDTGRVCATDWIWEDVATVAASHDTSMPDARNSIGGIGAYGPTFDRADIEAAIATYSRDGYMIETETIAK
jgi:hypothetical protein